MYIDWLGDESEGITPNSAYSSVNKGYGLMYANDSADSYLDAYNQNLAWLRDDAIRKEGYAREDTYYQRLFSDIQKAGLNPAVVLSGLSGSNYSGVSSASSFKSQSVDDYRHKKVQEAQTNFANGAKIIGAIAAIIGAIAML